MVGGLKNQVYQGFTPTTAPWWVVGGIGGWYRNGAEIMKIKLFYRTGKLSEFEQCINEFMSNVDVVDVKCTVTTAGNYEDMDSLTTVTYCTNSTKGETA